LRNDRPYGALGVRAAHAAGMPVIAVPNVHTRDNDFSLATRVLPSLHEVSVALLDSLVAIPTIECRGS